MDTTYCFAQIYHKTHRIKEAAIKERPDILSWRDLPLPYGGDRTVRFSTYSTIYTIPDVCFLSKFRNLLPHNQTVADAVFVMVLIVSFRRSNSQRLSKHILQTYHMCMNAIYTAC